MVTGHTNWGLNCADFAGTGIMVTGAASVGRVVTDVDLTISRATKEVVAASINNVIVRRDDKPAAADLTALIAKYSEIAAPTENRVLGTAPQPLTRTQNAAGESSLGDIIADAQLWATSGPTWPAANGAPAVVAFMNSGGIRADISPGPITYGEAFSVQPFANVLVTMDMTGAQIDTLLEQQFQGGNGVLQISGSLTYDRSQSAAPGNRISNIRIAGAPVVAGHDLPGDGQQLPRRRWRRLQHVHAGHKPLRRRDRPRCVRPLRGVDRHRPARSTEPDHVGPVTGSMPAPTAGWASPLADHPTPVSRHRATPSMTVLSVTSCSASCSRAG